MKGKLNKIRSDRASIKITIAIATVIAYQSIAIGQTPPSLFSSLSERNNTLVSSPPSELQFTPEREAPSDIEPSINSWDRVELVYTLEGYAAPVDSLVFSTDGKFLISGGGKNDPQLRFWSTETGKELQKFRPQRTAILTLAMSPNGSTLVSGGEDSGINLWDWQTGKFRRLFLDHSSNVTSTAITNDSNILVSGSLDGIRVWDLNSARPLYTLAEVGNSTSTIAVSPDGKFIASGSPDGKVKFWNLRTGTFISQFFPHRETISGLTFTNDGKLITAAYDRTLKIWDLASGKLLNTLSGHRDKINAIALNPDNRTLASAGNDGVFLWNLDTGELLTQIDDRLDWISSLAFSPDGHSLATGGYDCKIKIWQDALARSKK
jgi:COMPASS component SWD3